MKITYNGHSCFSFTSGAYTIVIDPYAEGSVAGYRKLEESANQVLCTHMHSDHAGTDEIKTLPASSANPFLISKFETYHDHDRGSRRGRNNVYILEAEGMKIVHMGDTCTPPTDEQIAQIRGCTVLMIPVGGFFTMDADEAADVAKKIGADITIPMHYSGENFGFSSITSVDPFLAHFKNITLAEDSTLTLPSQMKDTILVLKAKYLQE